MQRPTLEGVRIRSTRDALQVFYGVATNKLPLITRRLDAEERRAIVPGNVYVWEERGANTEHRHRTDGMGWGPSRVRDEFLFYHQKESDVDDDPLNPITPWAALLKRQSPTSRHSITGSEPERLVKQTYSVHVSLPADRPRGIVRKWHLTAYFSQEGLNRLATIDTIRGVGDVPVPEGLFRSARASKMRRDPREGLYPVNVPGADAGVYYPPVESHHPPHPASSIPSIASSSMIGYRPASNTSSSNSSPISTHSALGVPGQLVPLEHLQSASSPRRDPVDEQLLRRFNTANGRRF
ncbi:hypothetical protein VNI00_011560 [Paramarasmius palmivorus]|uniref:cAMP-independent regulatory protein pac2 n=1 Tax=Paramarasmius palmivorus TaxID=297713 RepID=A0AAW0CAA4_9AGAR